MREEEREKPATVERREIEYRGHVQGVGFRATTCSLARGFRVRGYVQNLANGDVRLVAEGEREELTAFLAAVDKRLGRYIVDAKVSILPANGEFTTFDIRYR